jgi:hypothetical protein
MLKAPLRLFATAILTAAFSFATTSAVNAASQAVCGAYADAAVKAALEVRQKECGGHSGDGDGRLDLSNPQWSTKREDHLRWCLKANQDAVDHEKAQRADKLAACTRCNDYSADALKAAKQVRDNACSYDLKHPQWSQNRGDHMRWCMAAKSESVDEEKSNRAHGVMICQDCADYVKLALGHAKENRDLKCGLKGARWDSTAEGHMSWCISEENRRYKFSGSMFGGPLEPSHTDDETNARAGAIAKCKQTKSAKQGLSNATTTAVRPSPKTEPKRTATSVEGVAKRSPSGGVDTVSRSGTTRSSGGSSSSAMDRLGGGMAGASSSGGQGGGRSATKTSAGGGASSPAPSGALSGPAGASTTRSSPGPAPGLGLR